MAVDVQIVHPAGCVACADFAPDRACLSHTCPDCGSVVWGEKNAAGELIHECPASVHLVFAEDLRAGYTVHGYADVVGGSLVTAICGVEIPTAELTATATSSLKAMTCPKCILEMNR